MESNVSFNYCRDRGNDNRTSGSTNPVRNPDSIWERDREKRRESAGVPNIESAISAGMQESLDGDNVYEVQRGDTLEELTQALRDENVFGDKLSEESFCDTQNRLEDYLREQKVINGKGYLLAGESFDINKFLGLTTTPGTPDAPADTTSSEPAPAPDAPTPEPKPEVPPRPEVEAPAEPAPPAAEAQTVPTPASEPVAAGSTEPVPSAAQTAPTREMAAPGRKIGSEPVTLPWNFDPDKTKVVRSDDGTKTTNYYDPQGNNIRRTIEYPYGVISEYIDKDQDGIPDEQSMQTIALPDGSKLVYIDYDPDDKWDPGEKIVRAPHDGRVRTFILNDKGEWEPKRNTPEEAQANDNIGRTGRN